LPQSGLVVGTIGAICTVSEGFGASSVVINLYGDSIARREILQTLYTYFSIKRSYISYRIEAQDRHFLLSAAICDIDSIVIAITTLFVVMEKGESGKYRGCILNDPGCKRDY